MRGRPRTPTALKALRGTLRADRANPNEPAPDPGIPPLRRGAAREVRREYERLSSALEKLRVVTMADGLALELCASALAEHRAALDTVLEKGHTYIVTTETGSMEYRRPEVAIAADAWRRATQMLQQFGLTPASRGKVSGQVTTPEDPLDAFTRERAAQGGGRGRKGA